MTYIYLAAVCLFAVALAQNHHPPNNNDNTHHHPHPGGEIHCGTTAECPACDPNNTVICDNHLCKCITTTEKRAVCHNGHQCTCPNGQNGVCNDQGHCECGDHNVGKRAVCHNGHQCTCPNGQNGVCNDQGHCECGDHNVGKRAGEPCASNDECAALNCDHGGVPTCEKHNDHSGHCHCKH